MQAGSRTRIGIAGLVFVTLASCDAGPFGASSFRAQYSVARDALEEGRYDAATRNYARLVERAGPHAPRIRLEYAHALLRAERYVEASQQASQIAAKSTGVQHGAALAVRGTADHERGLAALKVGDRTASLPLLTSAKSAFDTVLRDHPGLDPLGAMAGRQASLEKILSQ